MTLRCMVKGSVPEELELPGSPQEMAVPVAVQIEFPVPEAGRGMDLRGVRLSMDDDHFRNLHIQV